MDYDWVSGWMDGWTMIGCVMGLSVRGHSYHFIREIIVRTLASLRDALLPKLMRGEVRVKV